MDDNQRPGQLIVPHASDEPAAPSNGSPEPERPIEQPEPVPAPTSTPAPVTTESVSPKPASPAAADVPPEQSAQAPATGWQFTDDASDVATQTPAADLPAELNWTASEFIAHEKSTGWYGLLAVAAVVMAALAYLLTRDVVSTGVVVFAIAALGVFAGRKPRTQQYGLDGHGLQIGQKSYAFQDFKTFSVVEEGAIASIVFMPLKRFMPPLTIYVAPDVEDQVVDFLGAYLPFEQHKADAVDGLLKRIRF